MQEPINTVSLTKDEVAIEPVMTNSEARSVLENIVTTKPNRTKNIKGAFGSPNRRPSPTPTHTELTRLTSAAIMQGNKEAVSAVSEYTRKKIDWKTAHSKMLAVGFTTFGYRRGFVGATA